MKNNYLFAFALLFLTNQLPSLTAQSRIPDLQQALRVSPNTYDLLYELGKEYESQNLDSCFYYLNLALDIAQRENKPQAIAQVMYRLGYTYTHFLRNDAKATEWLNRAIEVAKKAQDNLNLARCYQLLGLIAYYQNSNKAEALLNKAIEYAKASNDWKVLVDTYDIMATRNIKLKRYKEAETASYNAMLASEKYSPDDWLSFGLDYTETLIAQNRAEEAHVFAQGLMAAIPKLKKSKGDFVYAMDLGRLTTRLKRYTEADSLFQTALTTEKSKPKPDTFRITIILMNLIDVYAQMGSVLKTRQIIDELTDIRLATKENRLTEDSKVKMTELTSALDLEKKEAEIALLDEQKKRQRVQLIAAALIALLLGGLLLVLQRNKRRIEHQKTELTALNATKDKLFSIVAHDLRSPIGALKNLMTMTNYGMMSQAEFTTASQKLTPIVNALFQSLDNLLHWSYSQQKGIKAKPETIQLHAIAEEQIKLLTEIAQQKNILVVNDISQEAATFADPNQIGLVIRNLVSNSLKFTHLGGKIVLESLFTEGGKLELKITDNGIGMSKEMQNQLFKIEGNVSRLGTSAETGQGLGLVLAKELIELNGGRIQVASEVGMGTVITLLF